MTDDKRLRITIRLMEWHIGYQECFLITTLHIPTALQSETPCLEKNYVCCYPQLMYHTYEEAIIFPILATWQQQKNKNVNK